MSVRWTALTCDYDRTLAEHGHVRPATVAALRRMRRSHRNLLLVTKRELDELFGVFPRLDLFDRIVAENGAVISPSQTPWESATPKTTQTSWRSAAAPSLSPTRCLPSSARSLW